jgi:glutathione S-transferase
MKLYDDKYAPNPRRVRIFLAEKGIELPERVQLTIAKRDNLSDEFYRLNPFGKLPLLQLDDGTVISESVAICRYFEEAHPEPPLMGQGAVERGVVERWERLADHEAITPVSWVFRNTWEGFRERSVGGMAEVTDQIPAMAERGKMLAERNFSIFDQHLAEREFVALDRFTIADITLFCALDFARVAGLDILSSRPNLARFRAAVRERPSTNA